MKVKTAKRWGIFKSLYGFPDTPEDENVVEK